MSGTDTLRVAYLGGLGRSGTTLFARLLGELPGVYDVGEVVHLWERGVEADERCGCGEPFHSCPFWTEVGAAAFGGWERVDVDRIRRLRAEVDRTRYVARLATSVPVRGHHLLAEYLDLHARLYAAIRTVSGCEVIVDGSKHGSLAFCLRWSPRIDVRVLHCVRDSRAVANSWLRTVQRPEVVDGEDYMPVFSPARSATFWNVENALFELLARRGTPVWRVRYEDLVRTPNTMLRDAARFVGVAPPSADLVTEGVANLSPSHSVSGNPMRFVHGEMRVDPDDGWRTQLGPRRARLVFALTWPLLLRYGYARS
jgi:hypothetical protein